MSKGEVICLILSYVSCFWSGVLANDDSYPAAALFGILGVLCIVGAFV